MRTNYWERFAPGDKLVIRGYGGKVLTTNAIYKRSYEVSGQTFVVFDENGVIKSVDAPRAELAEDAAVTQFSERLTAALDILGEIGANYCGDLTQAQAKRFHKLCEKLAALGEEVGL